MEYKHYLSQLFAAEENTIITTDIEPAISIDHNERLVEGIQSLQTVLGITEMTALAAGNLVKQYKYSKTNTPAQVGEGEQIGLTNYKRTLANSFELTLKKYLKQTTAEAIQRSGRENSVNKTDDLLLLEVQKDVKASFFETIKAGTGKATPKAQTLQGALAAIWGQIQVYFADVDATPVYFVNPLDIADYLATASITVQTAFGFSYVQNFLGLGTVILDASVEQGKVYGTVTQNLNGVYAPAGGDVAVTFGLTADATGLVGMKHFTKDDHASVDTLIMSGVIFYAEDASGIIAASLTA